MSYIGEARGFWKTAAEIREKLKDQKLTKEEREKLEKDLEWYEDEARMCWSMARSDP